MRPGGAAWSWMRQDGIGWSWMELVELDGAEWSRM